MPFIPMREDLDALSPPTVVAAPGQPFGEAVLHLRGIIASVEMHRR
jgi:hypothetical protein